MDNTLTWKRVVYYILGIIEALLGFRLIFKLLGANPENAFVSAIYAVSGLFLAPFEGIFRSATAKGVETQAVLEPSVIIAMAVYALVAWGVVKLIDIVRTSKIDNPQ